MFSMHLKDQRINFILEVNAREKNEKSYENFKLQTGYNLRLIATLPYRSYNYR